MNEAEKESENHKKTPEDETVLQIKETFPCLFCEKVLMSKELLKVHFKKEHSIKSPKAKKSREALNTIVSGNDQERISKCKRCGILVNSREINKHMNQVHENSRPEIPTINLTESEDLNENVETTDESQDVVDNIVEEGLNGDEVVTEKDVLSDAEEPSSTTEVVQADLEVESNAEDEDEESAFKEDDIVMVMRKTLKWPAMVVKTRRDECVVKELNKIRTKDVITIEKIENVIVDNQQMFGQTWVSFVIFFQILENISFKYIFFQISGLEINLRGIWK